jgi:hypothetical protein
MGAVIVNDLEASQRHDIVRYDIVRKDNEKALFWLESAADLSLAKSRVEQLLSFWPGEYQIFDLRTKEVVATASAPEVVVPVSNPAE